MLLEFLPNEPKYSGFKIQLPTMLLIDCNLGGPFPSGPAAADKGSRLQSTESTLASLSREAIS